MTGRPSVLPHRHQPQPATRGPPSAVSPKYSGEAAGKARMQIPGLRAERFRRALYRRAELHGEQRKIVVGIASHESVFSGQSW
jgi:hypothetical protein